MFKKDNIKPYDGTDAYYEGTDKDYEDFLKSVEGNINSGVDVDSEDERRIDLSETINLKGVFDIVKKKAGEVGAAAKRVTDDVREQLKKNAEAKAERLEDDETPSAKISETAKAAKEHIANTSADIKEKLEGISNVGENVDEVKEKLDALTDKLEKVASHQNDIEVKQIEGKNNFDRSVNDIRAELSAIGSDINEVRQNVNLIAKLNDSMFDLKNTQQNNKHAVAEVRAAVEKMKKKMIAGVTIVSILTAVVIVLQIINILF